MPIGRLVIRYAFILTAILAFSSPVIALTDTPFQLKTHQKNPIIWQGFGDLLCMTEDLTGGRRCYYFNTILKTSSILIDGMQTTAAPLGSQIKWLMYVDRVTGLDRLMAGDVDNDTPHVAVSSNRNQVGCGMKDLTCIYGQYRDTRINGHYPVDLYSFDVERGGATPFLTSDSEKLMFAHDGNLIVYRAVYTSTDSRIYGIPFAGGDEFEIAARDGYEPSVCGNIVAWHEKVGTTGFNIIGKNLETGEIRTIAYTTADPPRAEAGRGAIFWEDTRNPATGVDIYGYDWDTAQEYPVTTASGDQLRLRVCDDLVTWVAGTTNQILWGARILPSIKIDDLAVTLVTDSSVTLGWTSAGEQTNPPVAYDLRMRTDGPITKANWATSPSVPGLPAPNTVGAAESFTASSLSPGIRYFAIKAQLQNGDWSALSGSVCAYVTGEISALHDASFGSSISFTGVISGIGSGSAFYCQRSNRTQAVRCIPKSAGLPTVGQLVTVTGALTEDGTLRGPVLEDAIVSLGTGSQTVEPLGMRASGLGGFDDRYGGTDEKGPSNLWVRVRLWGKVGYLTTTSGCSFYLNDGSELQDNMGKGVYVTSRFAAPVGLVDGAHVSVDGICRLSKTDGRQIEVVESTGIRAQ